MAKSLDNLSIAELKNIKKLQKQKLYKEYSEYKKKQKLRESLPILIPFIQYSGPSKHAWAFKRQSP